MNTLSDLELVFLIIGISRPLPARYIGKSKEKLIFEMLKQNFGQYKNGSQVVFVKDFEVKDIEIENKKVLILK